MEGRTLAPVRATDESIKELNETLKENNRLTAEHNKKMLRYTRWLTAFTISSEHTCTTERIIPITVFTIIIAILTCVLVYDVISRIGEF